jgi:phosphatidylglycerol:prolipoprotein diacylglycerol transferase
MLPYPDINPEIFRIGPMAIRWYSLMYILGFLASYILVRYQVKIKRLNISKEAIDSLYSYLIVGLLIGARLGYIIFYNLSFYIQNPLEIIAVWHGGMSFHGGLIGSIFAGFIFCKRYNFDFWQMADLVIVTAPIGIGLGRIGNFINGELYGRPTNLPWAMIFPTGGPIPRHPSQIYEFFLEGVVLFILLWRLKEREIKPGMLSAFFLVIYGFFRFFIEFFREPDIQLGFILVFFTMGQILCLAMILVGALIIIRRRV